MSPDIHRADDLLQPSSSSSISLVSAEIATQNVKLWDPLLTCRRYALQAIISSTSPSAFTPLSDESFVP